MNSKELIILSMRHSERRGVSKRVPSDLRCPVMRAVNAFRASIFMVTAASAGSPALAAHESKTLKQLDRIVYMHLGLGGWVSFGGMAQGRRRQLVCDRKTTSQAAECGRFHNPTLLLTVANANSLRVHD